MLGEELRDVQRRNGVSVDEMPLPVELGVDADARPRRRWRGASRRSAPQRRQRRRDAPPRRAGRGRRRSPEAAAESAARGNRRRNRRGRRARVAVRPRGNRRYRWRARGGVGGAGESAAEQAGPAGTRGCSATGEPAVSVGTRLPTRFGRGGCWCPSTEPQAPGPAPPGMRVPRSGYPAADAFRSWRLLVSKYGTAGPRSGATRHAGAPDPRGQPGARMDQPGPCRNGTGDRKHPSVPGRGVKPRPAWPTRSADGPARTMPERDGRPQAPVRTRARFATYVANAS